ncbi:hypothetical protein JMJ58_16885 [Haloterrigena salifodinae]|uniref:Uncharacterized protein n=2 Tax=Haloterrigena salifodinae TaxID=2675099 RepID=A0A8T8E6U8_9EURY|nr:hypothetical protein JMJ58_16885 [Haloterrigena salifodinae]
MTQQIHRSVFLYTCIGGSMSNDASIGTRLKEDLTESFTVSVVSVLMALLALLALYSIELSVSETGGLLLALAVFIPYAYEQYWPITYSGGAAVVWTVSAALITMGIFIGTYQLAHSSVSVQYDGGIAFLVTVAVQYGIAAIFMRVYQNS